MDDLFQALTNGREILRKSKYEISSIVDDNSFASIVLPVYFKSFYDGNLEFMANNWSSIKDNECIVHQEIDEVINKFDNIQIINNVSYDISNDENQDRTDCTVK